MSKKELETSLVIGATPEFIARRILLIRGQKVMLDSDLAELYQVPTKRLNEQIKRNVNRFPADFMFQLSSGETEEINRSQFAAGSQKHRDPRFRPFVFTELGVAMLSSVLNSDRAIQMNIFIMRAFMKLREMLATHKDLAEKIEAIERGQKEHTSSLIIISKALNELRGDFKKTQNKLTPAIGFDI